MLIEIHMLQNHAPSNLNRDDTGSPKAAVFGDVPRARISSQCIKRSIRRSKLFADELGGRLATRTRRLPELVRGRLIARGIAEELAEIAARKVSGLGNRDGKEQRPENGEYSTAQTMFLTDADIDAVTELMAQVIEESGHDSRELEKVKPADLQKDGRLAEQFRPITVDIALFGRMITSDAFRDADAAMQVAHAISTHRIEQEYDYFTAVDDLRDSAGSDDAGADMIGDVEFNSACYYKYFSLDVDALVSNLTGEAVYGREPEEEEIQDARRVAADAVAAFLRAAALVTPSGKQNTFAAHQPPSLILAEVRATKTPISYANAFVKPVKPANGRGLVEESIARFAQHVSRLTAAFNLAASPRLVLEPESELVDLPGVERVPDLDTMAGRLHAVIHG
ncbi:MAG TPA: type I-E CRISPR-associated protein Cas7/Cse4/CasC [Longimicrobiales bacterium]